MSLVEKRLHCLRTSCWRGCLFNLFVSPAPMPLPEKKSTGNNRRAEDPRFLAANNEGSQLPQERTPSYTQNPCFSLSSGCAPRDLVSFSTRMHSGCVMDLRSVTISLVLDTFSSRWFFRSSQPLLGTPPPVHHPKTVESLDNFCSCRSIQGEERRRPDRKPVRLITHTFIHRVWCIVTYSQSFYTPTFTSHLSIQIYIL